MLSCGVHEVKLTTNSREAWGNIAATPRQLRCTCLPGLALWMPCVSLDLLLCLIVRGFCRGLRLWFPRAPWRFPGGSLAVPWRFPGGSLAVPWRFGLGTMFPDTIPIFCVFGHGF